MRRELRHSIWEHVKAWIKVVKMEEEETEW